MVESQKPMLDGTVETDETHVGGIKRGIGMKQAKAEKQVVIGIRQRGGDLRFFHTADAKSGTLARYIRENLRKGVDILITDDFSAYPGAMGEFASRHRKINHSKKIYVMGEIQTDAVESASLFSSVESWERGTELAPSI